MELLAISADDYRRIMRRTGKNSEPEYVQFCRFVLSTLSQQVTHHRVPKNEIVNNVIITRM